MTPIDFKTERLSRNEARKLISKIVAHWPYNIWFSRHAEGELLRDGLSSADAINLLLSPAAKVIEEGEFINESWRYRLQTANIILVIAFSSNGKGLTVVTGWDKRK